MSAPRRVLILGATSAIAEAFARRRADGAALVLAGRDPARLGVIADDLKARGAVSAEPFVADLAEMSEIDARVADMRARFGEPDEVLIAYGELGDQATSERDLAAARRALDVNFTSVALWVLALLRDRPADAPLTLAVIGSVAGDRGRASNFVYGSAKAALERFTEGLAQKHAEGPVHVLLVKPGFVDTPMTDGLDKGGPLWATPDDVAADIVRAIAKRRRVLYTPWFWWPIMTVIRALPWFVFKRLRI